VRSPAPAQALALKLSDSKPKAAPRIKFYNRKRAFFEAGAGNNLRSNQDNFFEKYQEL